MRHSINRQYAPKSEMQKPTKGFYPKSWILLDKKLPKILVSLFIKIHFEIY